jgi:limonene-1,2-epoxide hydrolase
MEKAKESSVTQEQSHRPERGESVETSQRETLNPDTVRRLWSRTYNPDGKPDWSHIYPHYHPEIVFQDSIQRIQGIEAFVALCERLTKRCEKLHMEIRSIAQVSNVIFMDWTMTMVFRKFPSTPIHGCTKLMLHEDGRIIEQRDYYDLWGDIFNGVPFFRGPYRSFMRRYFG